MQRILFTGIGLLFQISLFAQQGDLLKSEAIMYEGLGDYGKAALTYAKAVEAYQDENSLDTMSIYKAGQNYTRNKQYDKALSYLNKCKDLNYAEPGIYPALSTTYEGLKDIKQAESALKEGIVKFPEHKGECTKKLGYLYFNSRQYNKAADCLKAAIEGEPDNETFLYLYASSLEKLKKYDEAASHFKQILLNNPKHKKAITKLALILYKQTDLKYQREKKRYEAMKSPSRVDYHSFKKNLQSISLGFKKGLPYMEKAHEMSPQNKVLMNCLAVAYRRLNMSEKETAIRALLN